jgi:hypothetical protein
MIINSVFKDLEGGFHRLLKVSTGYLCREPGWLKLYSDGYGLDGQGSIPGRGRRFFSSPQCPDWLCDPPASYLMGTRGSFPGG